MGKAISLEEIKQHIELIVGKSKEVGELFERGQYLVRDEEEGQVYELEVLVKTEKAVRIQTTRRTPKFGEQKFSHWKSLKDKLFEVVEVLYLEEIDEYGTDEEVDKMFVEEEEEDGEQ